MSHSLKFNNLEENSQALFFLSNLDEQFRGYYIAKGITSLNYDNWNTIQKFSKNTTVLMDPNIENQKDYFQNNLVAQFICYYIAQNVSNSLNIVTTNQFKLSLNYQNVNTDLMQNISEAANIVEDVIVAFSGADIDSHRHSITIIEDQNVEESTLAYANPQDREIGVNTSYVVPDGILFYFNDDIKSLFTIVLVHEILHILGIGVSNKWYNNVTSDLFYIGEKGVANYKTLLEAVNFPIDNLIGIPVEDSFGNGTYKVHFEEGLDDFFNPQSRYDSNSTLHPSIPGEIMSGIINYNTQEFNKNQLTIVTLGLLEDMGYTVNYNSTFLAKSENVVIQDIP